MRLRAWAREELNDSCGIGIGGARAGAMPGPGRTHLMTEKEETLPTMVGEALLVTSITASELEVAPVTKAYEPDSATPCGCARRQGRGSGDSGGIGIRGARAGARPGPGRTPSMTEELETLPTMVGKALSVTSTTASESEPAPVTKAYEPDSATASGCARGHGRGCGDGSGMRIGGRLQERGRGWGAPHP